ncbi:MAG: hypothetical protein AAGD86_06970 [Pseudomonadota bacterium]
MNNKTRWLVAGVFLLNLLAVTWPGIGFLRAPEPFVVGLPLSMAWPVGWIVVGWVALLVLDHSERREDD